MPHHPHGNLLGIFPFKRLGNNQKCDRVVCFLSLHSKYVARELQRSFPDNVICLLVFIAGTTRDVGGGEGPKSPCPHPLWLLMILWPNTGFRHEVKALVSSLLTGHTHKTKVTGSPDPSPTSATAAAERSSALWRIHRKSRT